MQHPMTQAITTKFEALAPLLEERPRRRWAAVAARALGRGGMTRVAEATGLSQTTRRAGFKARDSPSTSAPHLAAHARWRRPGGGRQAWGDHAPDLLQALEALVAPVPRGAPMSPRRGTGKSAARFATALHQHGSQVRERRRNRLLHHWGDGVPANRHTVAGQQPPERDAPWPPLNQRVQACQRQRHPVVSVETKQKELSGPCHQGGREGHPQGEPEPVRVQDFPDKERGKVMPYGV
jgi:Rhodopirellula transposase DDE domain